MVFVIVIVIIALLCLGACQHSAAKYLAAVREGRRLPSPENRTGAQIALEFLHAEGVNDVKVVRHEGVVSDYFDPKRRCLYLRPDAMEGKNLAAWGIALHESAHALQVGEDMEALKWRRQCIAFCRYLPTALFFLGLVLLVLVKMKFRFVMIAFTGACAGTLLLNFGTLAIEFNANERLRCWLEQRLCKHPAALEKLESIVAATAMREVGDMMNSPRYFFLSALPGAGRARPT